MLTFPKVFPQVTVKVLNKNRMQPGLTLCNLYNEILEVPIMAIVLDPEGNAYWWYKHGNVPDTRGDIDIRTVPEGVLIGGTNSSPAREKPIPPVLVSWRKEILWTGKIVNHHHIHRTPEGNYMFLIAEERYFKQLNTNLVGDVIIEYDSQSDRVVWEWHIFDHVTPKVKRRDWSHCNTIESDPRDGSLYLSARNLNSIFKIDRKTGNIIWRIGEDGDFDIALEDRFYRQHAPEIQPNGNLLLFDNGTFRPKEVGGEYSRVLELCLDEKSMKAKTVWSWRNHPDLYAPIWGDADRLKNRNTLIVFGNRVRVETWRTLLGYKVSTQTTKIIEVTPSGEKVWELEFSPPQWGTYRAERIDEQNEIYSIIESAYSSYSGKN